MFTTGHVSLSRLRPREAARFKSDNCRREHTLNRSLYTPPVVLDTTCDLFQQEPDETGELTPVEAAYIAPLSAVHSSIEKAKEHHQDLITQIKNRISACGWQSSDDVLDVHTSENPELDHPLEVISTEASASGRSHRVYHVVYDPLTDRWIRVHESFVFPARNSASKLLTHYSEIRKSSFVNLFDPQRVKRSAGKHLTKLEEHLKEVMEKRAEEWAANHKYFIRTKSLTELLQTN